MSNLTGPLTVHLLPDDKSSAQVRTLYESAYPGTHRFVSFTPLRSPNQEAPTHLEHRSGDTFVCSDSYWHSVSFRSECQAADIVVLHSINRHFARALDYVRESSIVAWNGMGGDIYRLLPGFSDNVLMQPATMRVSNYSPRSGRSPILPPKWTQRRGSTVRKLAALFTSLRTLKPPDWSIRWERVDVFSGQEHEHEHHLLRLAIPEFRATPLELGWGFIEDGLDVSKADNHRPDIQVGHSAWPMNNHMEVLAQLARVDLSGRTVVLPLSYGSDEYADNVEKSARRMLGSHVAALRNFLPRAEYFNIISRCGVLFMNSYRVAGLGNIVAHLARGSRVVLPFVNPLLQRLKSQGFAVDSMPQTKAEMEKLLLPLPAEDQARNRELAYARWSREAVQSRISLLYHYWDIARQAGRCSRPTGLWG